MAEIVVSPGVFLRENDLSGISEGPIEAGAAIIGPAVSGPVLRPTVVTSYSQYKQIFGGAFTSGGLGYEYLTSMAALNYFEQGGVSLLVTRIASGSYTAASASISSGQATSVASATIAAAGFISAQAPVTIYSLNGNQSFQLSGSSAAIIANSISSSVSASRAVDSIVYSSGTNIVFQSKTSGSQGNSYYLVYQSSTGVPTVVQYGGGNASASFTLEALSVGKVMNNATTASALVPNGALPTGSSANIRFEVVTSDTGTGTFSLVIRRGDDFNNNKTILETWTGLSLDPNSTNYISYVLGDITETYQTDEFGNTYLQPSGSYANKSKYVRVKSVSLPTPGYLDNQGVAKAQYTSSIPALGSGTTYGGFDGGTGDIWGCFGVAPLNMFQDIPATESTTDTKTTNIQGVFASDYNAAIQLLTNKEAYDFNIIYAPGLNNQNGSGTVRNLMEMAKLRGDCIAVVDMTSFNQSMTTAISQASTYDNSYAATYWPWLQVNSRETGKTNFVPASTIVPAIYEYNDKVSAEWFAPAGLNRGAMTTVLRPERRLDVTQRNYLYAGKINPIASFAGIGTVVYGQKTLQAKASALDRVNVRRLLITLKRYIRKIAENLVFEPNTQATRNKFVNQINPYLEYVQQRQGLYAFQVIMDETNNTSDIIDQNKLVGAIYIQPTRVAEFIQLDFNILPTGASFGG